MNDETEGVIKFQLEHVSSNALVLPESVWQDLQRCRDTANDMQVIGQDDALYDGYGFGNISVRLSDETFVITGTQTGHKHTLEQGDYAQVLTYSLMGNALQAQGACKPSSEAMTHAAIYDAVADAQAIIHGHHAGLWQAAKTLGLCYTGADVPYGTPQMATAMQTLIQEAVTPQTTIVMLGHLDGFITWGSSVDDVIRSVNKLLMQLGHPSK